MGTGSRKRSQKVKGLLPPDHHRKISYKTFWGHAPWINLYFLTAMSSAFLRTFNFSHVANTDTRTKLNKCGDWALCHEGAPVTFQNSSRISIGLSVREATEARATDKLEPRHVIDRGSLACGPATRHIRVPRAARDTRPWSELTGLESSRRLFTHMLADFAFNNSVPLLPAIVLLNTTFRRRPKFPGRNVVFNKTIAGKRRPLSLLSVTVPSASARLAGPTWSNAVAWPRDWDLTAPRGTSTALARLINRRRLNQWVLWTTEHVNRKAWTCLSCKLKTGKKWQASQRETEAHKCYPTV